MKTCNKLWNPALIAAAAASALLLSSCGKSVELADLGNGPGFNVPKPGDGDGSGNGGGPGDDSGSGGDSGGGNGDGSGGNTGGECGNGTNRTRWSWTQPQPSISKSVDLLFVVDTSLSLTFERRKLSGAISSFLNRLPQDADIRIGVMLAHGGNSRWNGSLYSDRGNPRVINPAQYTTTEAQRLLEENLARPAQDFGVGNGEMLMHSLQNSLGNSKFAAIQSEGFYRQDASLAVVFVTDENDVCFDPRAHGYTRHPHYKYGFMGLEKLAYKKWCVDRSGTLQVSTTSVVASLQNRFPGKRIAMAGIVHVDENQVPRLGEEAIGHGIIELVEENASSQPSGPMAPVLMDIKSGSFAPALARLGSMVSSHLDLMTAFPLTGNGTVSTTTIEIMVDGRSITGSFDEGSRTVNIAGSDAGGAGSRVEVSACVL